MPPCQGQQTTGCTAHGVGSTCGPRGLLALAGRQSSICQAPESIFCGHECDENLKELRWDRESLGKAFPAGVLKNREAGANEQTNRGENEHSHIDNPDRSLLAAPFMGVLSSLGALEDRGPVQPSLSLSANT